MSPSALLLVFLTAASFGASLVAARFALREFTPLGYVAYRLLLAGFLFSLFYLFKVHPWPRDRRFWRHIFVIGIVGTGLPMFAFTAALLSISSGLASIFSASGPALIVLLAHFFLADEPMTLRKGTGVVVALAGAVLLVVLGESGLPQLGGGAWRGYALVAVALLSISAGTVYIRKFMGPFPTFHVTSMQVVIGALVVLPLAAIRSDLGLAQVTWQGAAALLVGGVIGTLVAFWLYIRLVQEHGATAASLTQYVTPVVATLGGWLLLEETFTWGMTAGVALILGGVTLVNRRQQIVEVAGR